MKWLGHENDEDGIQPNKEKVKAILELKQLKALSRGNKIFGKILTKTVRKNRQITKTIEEKQNGGGKRNNKMTSKQ